MPCKEARYKAMTECIMLYAERSGFFVIVAFIYLYTYLFCSGVKKPEFCLEYANFEAPMTSARGQSPVQTAKCALVTFRPESPLLSPWHRPERLN